MSNTVALYNRSLYGPLSFGDKIFYSTVPSPSGGGGYCMLKNLEAKLNMLELAQNDGVYLFVKVGGEIARIGDVPVVVHDLWRGGVYKKLLAKEVPLGDAKASASSLKAGLDSLLREDQRRVFVPSRFR